MVKDYEYEKLDECSKIEFETRDKPFYTYYELEFDNQ